jgi:hypothetical protein
VKKPYAEGEIDAIAAFSSDLDRCYFVPFNEILGRTYVQLRFTPCRNNQRLGVSWPMTSISKLD